MKLTSSFEKDDRDARCKVETPYIPVGHGYRKTMVGARFKNRAGQPPSLRSEYETIVFAEFPTCVGNGRLGREIQESGRCEGGVQIFQGDVSLQLYLIPVIKPGSFQRPVVHAETGNADDVKRRKCRGAKPGDIPGIRWYLRLVERDMRHQPFFSSSVFRTLEQNSFQTPFCRPE